MNEASLRPGFAIQDFLQLIERLAETSAEAKATVLRSIDFFLLSHGAPMGKAVRPLPRRWRKPKRQCFRNAFLLVQEHPARLIYAEGLGITGHLPIPVPHAWCLTNDGEIVDPTWENDGIEYFGIAVKTRWLESRIARQSTYGLLHQPLVRWPLPCIKPAVWRHPVMDKFSSCQARAKSIR